ncbi:MAG: hypothetical protein COV52_10340 [Gammaproteobacteria bacterium CG11_big_fil_rev_8_21_14_0_20_46_22]|nr:MAG: hypothetical protein COW05_09565 [Gammaproteobacteria bacterium CG12_big_fil_rev_8_21_14_0_65_46_12]PIR10095.1 MAG: hypothetical protein COV52_10340 [Gammaproteobacteria bacterium CG11_big_fil_rev_8_21_14_0_20_46_22]
MKNTSNSHHSWQLKAYVDFFVAAEAGDTERLKALSSENIVWDFNAGSQTKEGLPWIGLFQGHDEIIRVAQKIKPFKIEVLTREYDLIIEDTSRLIVFAKDTIRMFDTIAIENIHFANMVEFEGKKIWRIKTVEDNTRILSAYKDWQERERRPKARSMR